MKKTPILPYLLTVIAIVAITYITWSEGAASPQQVMKWEHLALSREAAMGLADGEFSRKINTLGMSGWELVDVENFNENGTTTETVYFFKRQKNG